MYTKPNNCQHVNILFSDNMDGFLPCSERTLKRKVKATVHEHMKMLACEHNSLEQSSCINEPHGQVHLYSGLAAEDEPSSGDQSVVGTEQCSDVSEGVENGNPETIFYNPQIELNTAASSCEEQGDNSASDSGASGAGGDSQYTRENLAEWAVKFNVPHTALSELLGILKTSGLDVPADSRTLLATKRDVPIRSLAGGKYHYLGVVNGIRSTIQHSAPAPDVHTLTLDLNIDGLPLFKSSSVSLWPILGRVRELPEREIFTIAVYSGDSKPSSLDAFLDDLVKELEVLLQEGLAHSEKHFKVVLGAFICDAPARAFLKGVKGHNSRHACERCHVVGEYLKGRMTFPDQGAALRTGEEFKMMSDEDCHVATSPLTQLNLDMVYQFPLDYMHLVCLGVVRKIIHLWFGGPLSGRLPSQILKEVSSTMLAIKGNMPREFARKPRSLFEYRRWKATEFRQFLLYTGPVVLLDSLPQRQYRNFMLLSVSCMILLHPIHSIDHHEYAKDLLKVFVSNFAMIYGKEMISYNVHSLIHLADDVKQYGALDNVSCFEFENHLGKLKKMVRKPQAPVAQVVRRIGEKEAPGSKQTFSGCKCEHFDGPVPSAIVRCHQYKQFHGKWFISTSTPDNCIEANGKVAVVHNVLVSSSGKVMFVVEHFEKGESFFTYPLDSVNLGIKVVSRLSGTNDIIAVEDVSVKRLLLPYHGSLISLPLLHCG